MSFLADIEGNQRRLKAKFDEIWGIVAGESMPKDGTGLTLKLSPELREKLVEAKDIHGIRTIQDTAYKALILGLTTLTRLPPRDDLDLPRAPVQGRVLTEEEVIQIKDEGFNCPRDGRPKQNLYADDDEERLFDDDDDEDEDE